MEKMVSLDIVGTPDSPEHRGLAVIPDIVVHRGLVEIRDSPDRAEFPVTVGTQDFPEPVVFLVHRDLVEHRGFRDILVTVDFREYPDHMVQHRVILVLVDTRGLADL